MAILPVPSTGERRHTERMPLSKTACLFVLVFSQLIEVQAEYHRKSLTLLQAVLPQIKAQQGKCKLP